MHNRGHVLSREQILRAVWGYEYDPATNVVDVYIGYLRRKLRRQGRIRPIVTVRSVGYRLGEPHDRSRPSLSAVRARLLDASRPAFGGG